MISMKNDEKWYWFCINGRFSRKPIFIIKILKDQKGTNESRNWAYLFIHQHKPGKVQFQRWKIWNWLDCNPTNMITTLNIRFILLKGNEKRKLKHLHTQLTYFVIIENKEIKSFEFMILWLIVRIPTVKLKIPGKAFLKSESWTSVTLKL